MANADDLAKLKELIDKTARGVLRTFAGPPATWSSQQQQYVEEIRRALDDLANSGKLKPWAVTSADEIRHVRIAIGFDSTSRTFVLNPEEMARQILEP